MNRTHRITSILNAQQLDQTATGILSFNLSDLIIPSNLDYTLPTNLRLGHLAERIVSELIESSDNYRLLFENIQIKEGKLTIGELDFIIERIHDKQLIHMELAYKFYLYDPTIATEHIDNWIGPNRNDSLIEKLEKLRTKQFTLLHQPSTQEVLDKIEIDQVKQALCFLVSLYVPYNYKPDFETTYRRGIKGYYVDAKAFKALDHVSKVYYLPPKIEWGMDPSQNETWIDFNGIIEQLNLCMEEKQAPLCWQKCGESFEEFFVVWW